MEKPAPNAIQRDAILAQSYFYVYRATSENKYKEYCRIIIDNLKNVVKHRQAQGLDWSYQEARHIMKVTQNSIKSDDNFLKWFNYN